jgi:hypothetical protein
MTRIWLLALLLLNAQVGAADTDLDAELEAEWGHKRVQTKTEADLKDQYAARLKLIENARDNKKAGCRGDRYCSLLAEEQFRKNKRALDARYEGHTNDDDF